MIKFESLKTENFLVRKYEPADAEALFEIFSDADTMKYVESPFDFEKTCAFMQRYGFGDNPKVFALIYDKSKHICSRHINGKRLMGHIIFHPYADKELEQNHGKNMVWELGFVLHKDFQGQGIATKLTHTFIDYAKQRGIKALILECDPNNVQMIRLAEHFLFKQYNDINDNAENNSNNSQKDSDKCGKLLCYILELYP